MVREWLITNGLGSYASLNYRNSNTRKFHNLLVASLSPPVNRWVFVSNCLDEIHRDNKRFSLHDVRGEFSFDCFPSFTYDVDGCRIKKTFFMKTNQNTCIIRYDVETDSPFTMVHLPMINSRHQYDLTHRPGDFWINQQINADEVLIQASNCDQILRMKLADANYQQYQRWHHRFYPIDRDRHDSCEEHVLSPGFFQKNIAEPVTFYLGFSIEDYPLLSFDQIWEQELARKQALISQSDGTEIMNRLLISADRFIVQKNTKKTIVAGYPWFSDWGRDTLIALPGLTLVSRRFDDAKQILLSFRDFCENGLIPNTFNDRTGEASYNSVDASLWYVDRVFQYLKYTKDEEFLQQILPTIHSIIEHYLKGTSHGIHMDDDLLISHDPGLTWMDVKLGEYYPTARAKKAVEIQALWYNALQIVNTLSDVVEGFRPYEEIAEEMKSNFLSVYDEQYDVIDIKDTSCRPNKIFLVSLDHTMIPLSLQQDIVRDIEKNLLTVFGLRSLSPDHKDYMGSYLGNHHRDIAYHNGTVWPWLLGSFITAYVKVHHGEKPWRTHAYSQFLKPMFQVFGRLWDGSIPEIFDADPPYAPRGCINQAWSVAEILRSWKEDIKQERPPFEHVFQSDKIRV